MTPRILPALLLATFSGAASAAAFQLWEQNASGLGTAYAGSAAVADNASTIFFNPAGMTQMPGIQLSAGVAGVGPSYEFSNDGSSGLLGAGGNGGRVGDGGTSQLARSPRLTQALMPFTLPCTSSISSSAAFMPRSEIRALGS